MPIKVPILHSRPWIVVINIVILQRYDDVSIYTFSCLSHVEPFVALRGRQRLLQNFWTESEHTDNRCTFAWITEYRDSYLFRRFTTFNRIIVRPCNNVHAYNARVAGTMDSLIMLYIRPRGLPICVILSYMHTRERKKYVSVLYNKAKNVHEYV